jgi:hypothetical protein
MACRLTPSIPSTGNLVFRPHPLRMRARPVPLTRSQFALVVCAVARHVDMRHRLLAALADRLASVPCVLTDEIVAASIALLIPHIPPQGRQPEVSRIAPLIEILVSSK